MEAQMQNDLKNGPGDSKIGFFHATLKRSGDVSSSEDEFVPNSDSRYIITTYIVHITGVCCVV